MTIYLNDALHQILLSQWVPAVHNLLQHSWKNDLWRETIRRGGKKTAFCFFIYRKKKVKCLLKRFECLKKKKKVFYNSVVRQQRPTCLYFSTLTPSSWLSRTRLVPTRILNSCRSFSLFSLSRLWPWCCILTHNLFISAKFRRTKSMESLISPVNSSESLWSKGCTSLTHQNFQKHNLKCREKNI